MDWTLQKMIFNYLLRAKDYILGILLDVDKEIARRSATGGGMDLDTINYELEERRNSRLEGVSRSLEKNL